MAFIDTEATPQALGPHELLTFRLWCGQSVRRGQPDTRQARDCRSHGTTVTSLAGWLADQCVGERTLWVYAHNLSFDLSVTRLLTVMAGDGWSVTEFGVTDRNPWFRLARGTKRVTLCDSWSWLPDKLEEIGHLSGVRKPALPDWSDDDAAWLTRCYGDVDVMAKAVLDLMDWWDRCALGRWTLTGASTGWNAMRHMTRAKTILVDPDPAARTFERRAVRGGRRDVWRLGEQRSGPYALLDVERAHSTIAQYLPLPFRRCRQFRALTLDDPLWTRPGQGAIAEALVETDAPRYPVKIQGSTWWPTGRFWTVLAWPELQMARQRGELVSVGQGYRYWTGRHLATWAAWVNRLAAGNTPDAPEVARLAGKAWGRSVVGKFAAHTSTVQRQGWALSDGWHSEKAYTVARASKATLVDIMGERWWVTHQLDADDCFPAVLAWVESELRVRMAAAIDALGPDVVVSCDTDGLIVDLTRAVTLLRRVDALPAGQRSPGRVADALCDWLAAAFAPLNLRCKEVVGRVTIDGPQQLTVTGRRHYSGVPTGATQTGPGQYVAHTWPKLRWQMAHGDPRGYVRPRVVYKPGGYYVRRWIMANGQLHVPQARTAGRGKSELVPWSELNPRPPFDLPSADQQATLQSLL